MEASYSTPGRTAPVEGAARLADDMLPLVWRGIAILFAALAIVLASRRAAGAMTQPLAPSALVLLGCVAAMAMQAAGVLSHRDRQRAARSRATSFWLVAAASCLLAWAVSIPGSRGWALAVMWLLVVGGIAGAWLVSQSPGVHTALRAGARRLRDAWTPRPAHGDSSHRRTEGGAAVVPAGTERAFSQHLMRWQAIDGADTLGGQVRADFAVGQRTASVHVAFCPPFAVTPRVQWRYKAGPPARTKVGQLLPYGARFDVKLQTPATEAASVTIEFTAASAAATGELSGEHTHAARAASEPAAADADSDPG